MDNITIFGQQIIDPNAIEQLIRCVGPKDIGVMTADGHKGYAHPIGGAVAYNDQISVSGVGYDIGCGNKAVKTNVKADDINVAKVMDQIFKTISFGVGRINAEKIDHEVIDKINKSEFKPQRKLLSLAHSQLGTVGSGNHYIDLFRDHDGWLWIGVHFGSRGFGHKTASGFLALAQGLKFEDKANEGDMDALPVLFDVDSEMGQDYIQAMTLAGEYAYAGRDTVVNKVLEILQAEVTFSVHNHHNFAWKERHFDQDYWVVRKGCTPAFPGQFGFIGANMHDTSVIIQGIDSVDSKISLYSTVHGAGRVMSRTKAVGKTKYIRDSNGIKRKTIISKGVVDFDKVKQEMKDSNIELRGAGADEAPQCYKSLKEVLGYHINTIIITTLLEPIGIAMAGEDVYDPYKD